MEFLQFPFVLGNQHFLVLTKHPCFVATERTITISIYLYARPPPPSPVQATRPLSLLGTRPKIIHMSSKPGNILDAGVGYFFPKRIAPFSNNRSHPQRNHVIVSSHLVSRENLRPSKTRASFLHATPRAFGSALDGGILLRNISLRGTVDPSKRPSFFANGRTMATSRCSHIKRALSNLCVAYEWEGTVWRPRCRSSPGSTASRDILIDVGTGLYERGSCR